MRPEWNRSLKHENERTARSSGRLLLSERVASTDSQPWARPISARVIGNSDVQQREQVVAIAKTKKEEKEESLYCACEQADFGVVMAGFSLVGMRGSFCEAQPGNHYPVDRAGATSCFLVFKDYATRKTRNEQSTSTGTGTRHRYRVAGIVFLSSWRLAGSIVDVLLV
jgi:hypothetical protein